MIKESIHRPFEVIYKEVNECPLGHTQHVFFQLAYVISGTGSLSINGNKLTYQPRNLFLLTPHDSHSFHIDTTTAFLLIRFNSSYVKEYRWKSIDHIECLLYYATHLSGCVMRCQSDAVLVQQIIDSLLHGLNHNGLYDEDLTTHFINALIVIVARNIAMMKPANLKVNTDKRIQEIIDYIQFNIHHPQKLKAAAISKNFGISETYLGSYFKNHCGENLQHFIAGYKLRLIEHRLIFSNTRINEIASEFGFADESHLNKFFKKHRSVNLTEYRKTMLVS